MSDLLSDPASLRRERAASKRLLSAARAVNWHEWLFAAGALAAALTVLGPWLLGLPPADGDASHLALERK